MPPTNDDDLTSLVSVLSSVPLRFSVCLVLNRHHKYPFDYAASEFGVSTQFNPTKMLIDGFAKLGLVTNRKRAVGAWSKLKERRDKEEPSLAAAASSSSKMKST